MQFGYSYQGLRAGLRSSLPQNLRGLPWVAGLQPISPPHHPLLPLLYHSSTPSLLHSKLKLNTPYLSLSLSLSNGGSYSFRVQGHCPIQKWWAEVVVERVAFMFIHTTPWWFRPLPDLRYPTFPLRLCFLRYFFIFNGSFRQRQDHGLHRSSVSGSSYDFSSSCYVNVVLPMVLCDAPEETRRGVTSWIWLGFEPVYDNLLLFSLKAS